MECDQLNPPLINVMCNNLDKNTLFKQQVVDNSTTLGLSDECICSQHEEIIQSLTDENIKLHLKISDLTGALKAREIENANLHETMNTLQQAVKQQDEVIAEIYATASSQMDPYGEYICINKSTQKQFHSENNQNSDTVGSAQSMLRNHLDSMGFQSSKVNSVMEDLSIGMKDDMGSRREAEMLNKALDKLLCTENIHEQASLSDTESETVNQSDRAPTPPLSKRSNSFKLSRETGWNNQASVAFLRETGRRRKARLSVNDFGLLSQESEVDSENNSDNMSRKCQHSYKTLFSGLKDVECDSPTPEEKNNKNDELTYPEFLERLSQPASMDILQSIRRFISSVVGPKGDGSPPHEKEIVDYTFYGTQNLKSRCQYFFEEMEVLLSKHPAWCYASEATLKNSTDGIEKYVMEKIEPFAMKYTEGCEEWFVEDEKLMRRMKLLSFVTPDMLDVKPCMRNEVVWYIAEDELRKINSFRSPGDKINCIVRCCSIIFSVLNVSRGDEVNRPGADDFLPVFIYIVLRSRIPNLYSNCEYIGAYRNKNDLMSKAGYCYVNLRSAIEFITVLDSSMLTIYPEEFEEKLHQAEQKLMDTDEED